MTKYEVLACFPFFRCCLELGSDKESNLKRFITFLVLRFVIHSFGSVSSCFDSDRCAYPVIMKFVLKSFTVFED